jgi:hypothetical protein
MPFDAPITRIVGSNLWIMVASCARKSSASSATSAVHRRSCDTG